MPGNREQGGSGQSEKRHRRPSYLEARQYPSADEAARAYFESQETIRRDRGRADLSVYRLMIGPSFDSHVVVLGDTPNKDLFDELERTLSTGTPLD